MFCHICENQCTKLQQNDITSLVKMAYELYLGFPIDEEMFFSTLCENNTERRAEFNCSCSFKEKENAISDFGGDPEDTTQLPKRG